MFSFLTGIKAKFLGIAAAIAVLVVGLFVARQSGKMAADQKNKIEKLEADKATSERIDNATPTKNVDDARDNLAGWMRKPRK